MVNDYSDSTISDYINTVRQEIAQNRAERNKSTNPIVEYQLDQQDSLALTDSTSINNNTQTASDSLILTDTVSRTDQSSGTFLIDTALIDFSDVG